MTSHPGRAAGQVLSARSRRFKQYTIRDLTPLLSLVAALAFPVCGAEPPAARTVALHVVDRLGRPVSGVTACLLPACSKVSLRAEKDGLFAEVPGGGEALVLRVSARSFEATESTLAPEAATVDTKLKAKGSVKASFLAVDEKRSGRLSVSLAETVDPKAGTKGRLVAEKGVSLEPRPAVNAVVLDDVPPGDWVLRWEGASLSAGSKVVRVGETRADAGTIQTVAGRSVEGAVRDDLGVVVAGARVRIRAGDPMGRRLAGTEQSARTGSDGSFTVSGLPLDEAFRWDVTSPEHETARGALGGETRLEVVLTRAQRVKGRLVDEEERPVPDAGISVSYVTEKVTKDAEGKERRFTSVEGHSGRVVTGDDGRFWFFRSLPISVQISPQGTDHLPETRALEALSEGAERRELDLGDLVLRKGRRLTGRVAKADGGAPVAGARLDARWRQEEAGAVGNAWATTEADGTFVLTGIVPGREVRLTARKEGFAPRTLEIDPEADSVDVLLGRGGRVLGRACGTASELASMAVWYGGAGAASNENHLDVDSSGRFVLEDAEPGSLTFIRSWRFRDPARPGSSFEWSGRVRASVEVREGETSRVSLGCDGIPLSGLVTRGGRPVASEIVSFSLEGAPSSDALTDANGGYATRVLSPGRWLLSAGGSALTEAAGCEVPPGGLEGCRVELAPAEE